MEYRCNFSFSEIVDTGCLKTNDCVTTYLGLPSWNVITISDSLLGPLLQKPPCLPSNQARKSNWIDCN